jgi:uncharacterized membrane protein YgcG
MDHQRRVQVVLGEAERTDGLLRFVLEAEGFDIVGLASDDHELVRVLRGARPAVVVLDGGISVAAAVEARQRADGAAFVVVWPDGVSAVIAEERVDPYEAIADLGDAVRRAAHQAELGGRAERREAERRRVLIHIPEARDVAPTIVSGVVRVPNDRPTRARSRGRRARLLVAAATWMLVLTALTTIAIAVPNALGLFPGRGGARPSLIGSVNRRPADPRPEEKTTTPERAPDDPAGSTSCDAQVARHDRADRSDGHARSDSVRARACPQDHGQHHGKSTSGKKDGGRPDDPGSKANGNGSSKKEKPKPRGGDDGSQGGGGSTVEHGNGGGSGSGGKDKEKERTRNGGRSEHGNAG